MYEIKIDRRSLGCNFSQSGEAGFTVWAPFAERVAVEIIGKELIEMNPLEYGYWYVEGVGVKTGDQYYFQLNGNLKYPDPASLCQPEGVHGPSLALDLQKYAWKDEDWKGIGLDELIIYELHTGSFTPEGTFEGIIDKLDYLVDLGITAIELMPVSRFPGERNWGYDGVFVYAVQDSYGGVTGLRELVEACHEKSLAVILDVVYNHNGPEGNYLPDYGPYFTDKYTIPWGRAVNYDDAYCYGVRQYYIENALMWFRDFHLDALRLDAVHAIKDLSTRHFLAELSENVAALHQKTGKKHLLIGECDLNDVRYIDPVEEKGYGLEAQWCDEFHHALHAYATGERLEYYADFGRIEQIAKTLKDGYVYDGKYSPHRKKVFGSLVGNRKGNQFVVFIQNHDQVGNRMRGERLNTLVDFEMFKLLAGILFISPYIPLIFMGEEYGESNPFLYFNSHGDPELIQKVREGRKNEFLEFYGQGEPVDAQEVATFHRSKLSWNYLAQGRECSLLRYYKYWIRLRKEHPVLMRLDREGLSVKILEGTKILVVDRSYEQHRLVGFLNFRPDPEKITLSQLIAGGMNMLLDSSAARWGGTGSENADTQMKNEWMVNGHSILVFSN
jgi:maltooligosyltrehalose trehalohydrolase